MSQSLNINWIKVVKIRNYFSDRIDEIKEGSYVPTYEQIKELPEFRGISIEIPLWIFRKARKEWYSQHFSMPFGTFNRRLEKIKARNLSEEEYNQERKKNKFIARLENTKADYISEKDYAKKKIKEKGNYGYCCITCGVIPFLLLVLYYGDISSIISLLSYGLAIIFPPIFFLLGLGIFLIIYYSIKASKI